MASWLALLIDKVMNKTLSLSDGGLCDSLLRQLAQEKFMVREGSVIHWE